MSFSLECRKVRRTGFIPAFLGGGLIAAAVPVLNMAVRAERFTGQQGSPVFILLNENWRMVAMLNVLLIVAGACLLYHTEYADNAIQKMKSLPVRESASFLGKFFLTALMGSVLLWIEAASVAFCSFHWFETGTDFWMELSRSFGYAFLLMLPCILLSLLIASACENMWISLGIGVVCVFMATMLPTGNFMLSLFPFAMSFQIFSGTDQEQVMHYICGAGIELVLAGLAELLLIHIRREFE